MAGNYKFEPADFGKISTYSVEDRKSLVNTAMFADPDKYASSGRYEDLLPSVLKARDLKAVAEAIHTANKSGAPVVVAMGAHVIKCGLSPILIEMMRRGMIDALAMNGACVVHDLEIAYHGATSEDVAKEIGSGRFGMVEQTANHFNTALKTFGGNDTGLGEALGKYISTSKMPNARHSLIASAWEMDKPVTVHVALGTDIIHANPGADWAAIGRSAMNDFKLFTGIISNLRAGVYMNIGSAVIMPEVFIKALSVARNIGRDVSGFMTVNMDMIAHYRPSVNVVNRPTQDSGRGISIIGHHEIMIPLLYHLLVEKGNE